MLVEFYLSSNGRSPVFEFIHEQEKANKAMILAVLKDIQHFGFNAKGCLFKNLGKKLWEIKIRTVSTGYRFLYALMESNKIIILHGFKKKTQKTPLKEITLARKRLNEITQKY